MATLPAGGEVATLAVFSLAATVPAATTAPEVGGGAGGAAKRLAASGIRIPMPIRREIRAASTSDLTFIRAIPKENPGDAASRREAPGAAA
jgi:hypothetical protein